MTTCLKPEVQESKYKSSGIETATIPHALSLALSCTLSLARALSRVLSLNDGARLAEQHSERIRNLEASQHNGFDT